MKISWSNLNERKRNKEAAELNGGEVEDAECGVKWGFATRAGNRVCKDVAALYTDAMAPHGVKELCVAVRMSGLDKRK